ADPVFLVQERHRIYGIDTQYDPPIAWLHEDESVEVDEFARAVLELSSWYTGDAYPDGYRRVGYAEEWRYVQPFFTEAAAGAYIAQNKHRHQGPLRTYVDSAYRNYEWQAVSELLMSPEPRRIA